ncbi:MAG: metal-dependent transcriptional regulator [Oscillospiraceae bacterium]|nr:metal-dependent transcriptional regulator [Oscillospiraceae bacterium]MCL2159925.1 metal-dependent transcriptional regulator [Oscillospiraceae bacterium]
MKTHESAENYLETIFILGQGENKVRSIDIAGELGYSKPSVSVAMKNLRKNGHIEVDRGGYITLTENGLKIAQSMYDRHVLLSDWLIGLGVDKKTAIEDACAIEHHISVQSFEAIQRHINV